MSRSLDNLNRRRKARQKMERYHTGFTMRNRSVHRAFRRSMRKTAMAIDNLNVALRATNPDPL